MDKQTPILPHHKRIITLAAFAAIISGAIFVMNYPRAVLRYELDTQRMLEAQDLEQALEWYLIREASTQNKNMESAT